MQEETKYNALAVGIVAALIAAYVAVRVAWAEYVFHDWTCAITHCVRVR